MADGLKQRENLYKLMISQLRYDGFDAIANNLAKVVNIISACPPMARLYEVVNLGIQAETEGVRPEPTVLPGLTPSVETSRGIDLEYEPEGKEVNGEWQNSTTDESFMNNLELQKVDQDCESEPEERPDDSPLASMVLNHILRITSDKKFTEPPQALKPTAAAAESSSGNGHVLDTESICEQVKLELVKYNVSQEVFAKAVLGKSQGYLSEMLKHGENFFRPQDNTHYKGWMNFEIMRQFLQRPEAERLRIYYQKGEELKRERMKRRQIEIGLSDDALRKRRRYIPTEAKAVMEDYYHRSKYLSLEKRQTLANQLAIPEQCVSDYFKNLRSKKKHEERMKCLLKGLEHGEKQPDQTDSGDEDEDSMENDTSEHQGLCSRNNSAEQTSSASVEASPQPHGPVQSPSLIQSCGRRFNISPPVSASSQAFQASSERKVSETDLVASKIAALTQGQKSSNRQSGLRNTQSPSARSKDSELQVSRTPTSRSAHRANRESTVPSTRCLSSQTPVSSSEEVETFSLDSLIDGACSSVMLQGGTPETDGLEVGQQIYVVHVNNPAVTSVQN